MVNSPKHRQYALLIIIVVMWSLIVNGLHFFLEAFLGALLVYAIVRRLQHLLTERFRWNATLAALTIIMGSTALLVLLFSEIVNIVLARVSNIDTQPLTGGYLVLQEKLEEWAGADLLPADLGKKIADYLVNLIPTLFNSTYALVVNYLMMCFLLYFMLIERAAFERGLWQLLPLSEKGLLLFREKVKNMIMSNVVGVPIMMIIQSVTAIAGYLIFGVREPFFWGLITGFFSIFPIVGTTLIWGPLGIALLTQGEIWQGAGLLLFGALVVSNIDNLFRFMVLKKMGNIHPLITVLGIIIGLGTMGFMGIIFGPVFLAIAILMVQIYREEYLQPRQVSAPEEEQSPGN